MDYSNELLNLLRLASRITCSCRAREKFESGDSGDPAIVGRQSLHFLNHCWYAAKQINARIGVEQKSQGPQNCGIGGRLPCSGRRKRRSAMRIRLKKFRGHRRFDFGSMITAFPSLRIDTSAPLNR